jgi:hypothetical protein
MAMVCRLFLASVALLMATLATAHAQTKKAKGADQWTVLATREIDLSKGTAAIDLVASKGAVKATRVRATTGTLTLSNVKIDYAAPAQSWNEQRSIRLRAGGSGTNPINRGGERVLTGVTLSFNPEPGQKAVIEVLGLQSASGAVASRPAPSTGSSAAKGAPTSSAPGARTDNGAIYFGHQYVNFIRDRDVIRVPKELGQFDRLQLRVLDNDIFIEEMNVVYVDGQTARIAVNAELKKDTRSGWLKLPAGDRFIDRVEFAYRSKPNARTQARVELYGELSEGWLGKNGRARKYNEGWVLLAAQTAGRYLRLGTDVIPVGRNEGEFKRLRINVKDRDLILQEIRVIYLDNQEEVFTPKTKVTANSTFGPINLKGESPIRSIRATYRSAVLDAKAIGKGASVVEIWGQH